MRTRLLVAIGLVSSVAAADPKPVKPTPITTTAKIPPLPPQIDNTLFSDIAAANWQPVPELPKGALGALIGTEPASSGMAGWLKFPPGYRVPTAWETHLTNYVVISGQLTIIDNGVKHALGPGGFALVGSKDKHELRCGDAECVIMVRHYGPPDMHWVAPPKK